MTESKKFATPYGHDVTNKNWEYAAPTSQATKRGNSGAVSAFRIWSRQILSRLIGLGLGIGGLVLGDLRFSVRIVWLGRVR